MGGGRNREPRGREKNYGGRNRTFFGKRLELYRNMPASRGEIDLACLRKEEEVNKKNEMTVSDVLGDGARKKAYKNARLIFKGEGLNMEADVKYERLDSKKILPFEEYEALYGGKRVKKKMVGCNRGEAKYFLAVQDAKGKWVAGEEEVREGTIEKVLMDKRTGQVTKKDTRKGVWFKKLMPASALTEWPIEHTYNFWSEDNSDSMLKIYQFLVEHKCVGVYKFNPYGTAYNGFLVPQTINGAHFRLLLMVARVKTNKPEISPTMVIKDAEALAKQKQHIDSVGVASALDEV
jgi:hypothetical protein